MRLSDLRIVLEKLDIPVQYRAFEEGEAPSLPYILFYVEDNDGSLKADNHNFFGLKNVTIEVYSDKKDPELEESIESLLDGNRLEYDFFETYIETEKMNEAIYEITI